MRLVYVSVRGVGGCTPLSVVTEIAVHSDPVQNRLPDKKIVEVAKKKRAVGHRHNNNKASCIEMFWFSESIVRPRVSIVGNTPTPLCSCCHNCTLSLPQWPSAATHLRHWRVDSSCTPLPLCLCFIWRSYAIGNLGLTPRGIEESQTRSAVGRRLFFLCRYLFFFLVVGWL